MSDIVVVVSEVLTFLPSKFAQAGRHLFADGNVSSGFDSFETDHVCNKFCQFFGLTQDYTAAWVPPPAAPPAPAAPAAQADIIYTDGSAMMTKSMEISKVV